jgi:ubiquinone/menaquinone biosynthesis C-methylase UbiE
VKENQRYNEAWATGDYRPMNGLAHVQCLYRTYFFAEYRTLLDVGCGMGVAVRYHRDIGGIKAYGIDFAKPAIEAWHEMGVKDWCLVASAESIPFHDNEFDMVTCMDMMEHVPEANVDQVLREIYRVSKNDFLFMICLVPSQHKMPHDGSEPHICLKTAEWWVEKMGRIGYRYRLNPTSNGRMLHCLARKDENKHRRYKSLQ